MMFRYLLLVILGFSGLVLSAQRAENVLKSERENQISQIRACDNDAGSITLGSFIGQSDRHDIEDTIFLCWQDRFYIDHNKDFNLSGDPVPSTNPGIGYAWYDRVCP